MIPPEAVRPGVYAITPDGWTIEEIVTGAESMLCAGLRLLQVRSKHLDTSQRETLALALKPRCAEHGVPLLINDDAVLASRIGVDGVHLGRGDGDIADARELLGPTAWIGASCYADLQRADRLANAGATYVAFGAIYPTASKSTPHRAPLQLFRDWKRDGVPSVAIGGIDAGNAASVAAAGPRWLAVIGALWNTRDPASVVRQMNACFPSDPEYLPA
jgi:thiamine-phosphate pyrophosphorylase